MGHGAGSECTGERHEHVFESNQLCNVRSWADEPLRLCGQGVNGNYDEPIWQRGGRTPTCIWVKTESCTGNPRYLESNFLQRGGSVRMNDHLGKYCLRCIHKSRWSSKDYSIYSNMLLSHMENSPSVLCIVYSWWNTSSQSVSCNEIAKQCFPALRVTWKRPRSKQPCSEKKALLLSVPWMQLTAYHPFADELNLPHNNCQSYPKYNSIMLMISMFCICCEYND